MSSISITIPDDQDARVVNAYCAHYAYRATVSNPAYVDGGKEPETIPNPQSKVRFVKAGLIKHLREAVRAAENSVAVLAARDGVQDVEGLE